MSICGVNSVVINSWSTSMHANRRLLVQFMPELKKWQEHIWCAARDFAWLRDEAKEAKRCETDPEV